MTRQSLNDEPAFVIETTSTPYAPGMTLRDWFAGHALVGLLADQSAQASHIYASSAYQLADAMLAERLKVQKDRQP